MIRRLSWRKVFVAALCLLPVGCESLREWRHKDDDDMMADSKSSSTSKIIGSSADDKDSSSFFQNDRSAGGLSSTARSIEKDLGAY
jgi:hypothetical protein